MNNTQQYSCQHCYSQFSTIFEVFLHIYTCHRNGNHYAAPLISETIISSMVGWMEWHNHLGRN